MKLKAVLGHVDATCKKSGDGTKDITFPHFSFIFDGTPSFAEAEASSFGKVAFLSFDTTSY